MSRNLASTHCDFCGAYPVLIEDPRPITKEEAGRYFNEYEGMLVANADCPFCWAKYLAWVDESGRSTESLRGIRPQVPYSDGVPFFDLSFRSTFNDEPGDEDRPERSRHRVIEVGEPRDLYFTIKLSREAASELMAVLPEVKDDDILETADAKIWVGLKLMGVEPADT